MPLTAVLYGPAGTVVQVVRRARVETRRVEVGLMSGGQVEIREGLQEGDIVVARAGALLREGDPVRAGDGGGGGELGGLASGTHARHATRAHTPADRRSLSALWVGEFTATAERQSTHEMGRRRTRELAEVACITYISQPRQPTRGDHSLTWRPHLALARPMAFTVYAEP